MCKETLMNMDLLVRLTTCTVNESKIREVLATIEAYEGILEWVYALQRILKNKWKFYYLMAERL